MGTRAETGSLWPIPAALSAFAEWCRIIGFLTVDEFGEKFKGSRLEAVAAFLEPFVLLALLCAIKGVFRDRLPVFGTSIFVFMSTGVFPYYLFRRVTIRARGLPYDPGKRYPRVTSSDVVIASVLAETTTMLSTMILWFATMWFMGLTEAAPASLVDCAQALFFLLMMGFGIGLFNSALMRRFAMWHFLYGKLTYHLPFISGVMTVTDILPLQFRKILLVNPLTHAIEWFRVGIFGHYPHATLDKQYLISCACFALLFGLLAHRTTIRLARR